MPKWNKPVAGRFVRLKIKAPEFYSLVLGLGGEIRMKNARMILAFAAVMVLVAPLVVTSVHAISYYTLQLGVSGHGTLNWVGMYQGSIYTSGTTISNMVITVPEGTDLTFTATPSGDSFDDWMLDQSSQVSTNPYVIASIGDWITSLSYCNCEFWSIFRSESSSSKFSIQYFQCWRSRVRVKCTGAVAMWATILVGLTVPPQLLYLKVLR